MNFLLFSLLSFLVTSTTLASNQQQNYNEKSFDRVNNFFESFEAQIFEDLEGISCEVYEISELSEAYTLIISFPSLARDQLFIDLLNINLNSDIIYNIFLDCYKSTIGAKFSAISNRQNGSNKQRIDAYISKFSSDLKDIIVIKVKSAVESLEQSGNNNNFLPLAAIPEPETDKNYCVPEFGGKISGEEFNHKKSHQAEESEAFIEMSPTEYNCVPNSKSIISYDLFLHSKAILNYGMDLPSHLLNIAKAFIDYCKFFDIKIADPRSVFPEQFIRSSKLKNINISHDELDIFCAYVAFNDMPITSQLFLGTAEKSDVSALKREVLLLIAKNEILRINQELNDNMDGFVEKVIKKDPSVEKDFAWLFVDAIHTEINTFLLSDGKQLGGLSSGLEAVIKAAYLSLKDLISFEQESFYDVLFQAFMTLFESPLALVKDYDNIDEWKKVYSEDLSDSSMSGVKKDSSFKSVKIDESKSEIHWIKNISDIIAEMDRIEIDDGILKPIPLRRKQAYAKLSDLFIPNENKRPNSPLTLIPAAAAGPSNSSNANSKKIVKVPDFPFENPSQAIENPNFIISTGNYLLENGNNPDLMLENRIDCLKGAVANFAQESFEDPQTGEAVQRIINESLEKVFKFW